MQNQNYNISPTFLYQDQIATQQELDTVQQVTTDNQNQILVTQTQLQTTEQTLTTQIQTNYNDLLNKVNNIVSQNIVDFTIEGIDIKNGTLTAQKLIDNINLDSKLLINSINGNKISDNTIDYPKLINNIDINQKVAVNNIGLDKIQDQLPSRLIQSDVNGDIVAGLLQNANILDNSITGAKITDRTISNLKIQLGTITGQEIAGNTIQNNNIANDTINGQQKIQDGSISSEKISLPQGGNPGSRLGKILINDNNNQVNWDYINQTHIDGMLGQLKPGNLLYANSPVVNYVISYDGTNFYWKEDTDFQDLPSNAWEILSTNGSNVKSFQKVQTNMLQDFAVTNEKIATIDGIKINNNSIALEKLIQNSALANRILKVSPSGLITAEYINDTSFSGTNYINGDIILQSSLPLSKMTQETLDVSKNGYILVYNHSDGEVSLVDPASITSNIPNTGLNQVPIWNNTTMQYEGGYISNDNIIDNGISYTKLNSNVPVNNQVLTYNSTLNQLEWKLIQNDNIQSLSGAKLFSGTISEDKLQQQIVNYFHLKTAQTPTDGQVLAFDQPNNDMKWIDVQIADESITEAKLAISNLPLDTYSLTWSNSTGLTWADVSGGAGVPDNYFSSIPIVNAKFVDQTIPVNKLRTSGTPNTTTSYLQYDVPSQTLFSRQIFQDHATSNVDYEVMLCGIDIGPGSSTSGTFRGHSSYGLKYFNKQTSSTHMSNGLYMPSGWAGQRVKGIADAQSSGEACGFAFCSQIDRIMAYTATDLGPFGREEVMQWYDQDNIDDSGEYNTSAPYYYINFNQSGITSNPYVKHSIREKECSGYLDQLMKLDIITYKYNCYDNIVKGKNFKNYDEKKQKRLLRKQQQTHMSVNLEQMQQNNIFTGCYLQKIDCPEYEQIKKNQKINEKSNLNLTDLQFYTLLSVQDLVKNKVKPMEEKIEILERSYQRPEERKELIKKIEKISQEESRSIINEQQSIPMSSIRGALSDGILMQINGNVTTYSGIDAQYLDSIGTLINDQSTEISDLRAQVKIVLNSCNTLQTFVEKQKTKIQTLETQVTNMQMRMSNQI